MAHYAAPRLPDTCLCVGNDNVVVSQQVSLQGTYGSWFVIDDDG